MSDNTFSRVTHDLGLAGWFGGTLANAVALNRAAGQTSDDASSGRVANAGWDAWTPVNAGAIGLHLVGSVGQLVGNKGRVGAQRGVGRMVVVKTLLTAAALGATAWSRALGRTVSQAGDVSVADATTPQPHTPDDVATAQRRLRILQWVVPALTGALVVVSAVAGEQQRPAAVVAGVARRALRR